jgi:hypothetical protein
MHGFSAGAADGGLGESVVERVADGADRWDQAIQEQGLSEVDSGVLAAGAAVVHRGVRWVSLAAPAGRWPGVPQPGRSRRAWSTRILNSGCR